MQHENVQSELVEKYVMGKLSPSDVQSFEKELNSNAQLKSEVSLQKAIQEALIEERKAELKAMLQAVAVGATPTIYTWLRYAAVSTGLGIGVWFGWQQLGAKKDLPQEKIVAVAPMVKQAEVIQNQPQTEVVESKTTQAQPLEKEIAKPSKTQKNRKNTVQKAESQQEELVNLPVIEHNDEHHGLNNHPIKSASAHEMPNGNIAHSITESGVADVSVKYDADKFHYKFNGEKLVLVGDFSNGQYEILELNKNNKKTLYLYYQKEFYNIENNNLELSPLQKLTDNLIRKELKIKVK